MKLFLCIDDEGGMAFVGRRVSRDRAVTEDIVALADGKLAVFPYSERLFREAGHSPRVISDTAGCDALFIEDRSPRDCLDAADTLIIYKWNRLYPSDLKIGFSPEEMGYKLESSLDLVGKSHEKITREIYTK